MKITMRSILNKIAHKLTRLRLQPIRVFCFHQTSELFDADVYCKPDWVPTPYLKQFIEGLQREGYEYISLAEAHKHLQRDMIRRKKYAVLTADDGLKCQLDLLSWLEAHKVPITLFVNVETLNGDVCGRPMKEHFQIENKEEEKRHAEQLYLAGEALRNVSPIVSIGMHGVNHDDVTSLSVEAFREAVDVCKSEIGIHPQYIPFYAYTFGRHTRKTDAVLHQSGIVPVLSDGGENYNDAQYIHREIIEVKYKECK